ncbi:MULTISPECIES: TetR/AcrR family transcriptional regulator [unclassified Janthinobacterium]|uniref:TetR/AcrR family transcriptional regulator n=1 Tax=unclassified Janthinobacterium TaxID=2610881 RepID=UPI0016120055|nr:MULTISPECIES: TetR/AcrR family transcriptional regulator [unclassified Janthinobacterium]MBB5370889.1 AcrR family transcriptional regulator [Janthinobacterium sp. K2C7]MBB5383695.1 AcrR family transcriptional regulator [Janthinobacterium sp. K2Li3]MBB5388200.1 AcrR family transcriptional regulator [Janthinobacterium sp. K2E3]
MSGTPENILDAAAMVLSRDRSASIQQIAKAAGLSRTTLARYFATRELLIAALVERVLGEALSVLDAARLEDEPVAVAFQSLTQHYRAIGQVWGLGYGLGYSWLHLVELVPGMDASVEKIEQRLHAFFERGQAQGVFRQDMPAQWLVGALQGLAETTSDLIADEAMGARQGADFLLSMFLNGGGAKAGQEK